MRKNSFKHKNGLPGNINSSYHGFPGLLLFLLLFWCIFFSCTSGCTEQNEKISTTQPLVVACTIPPQEEFIREVAGDYPVSILVMVPPGSSPHTFEPAPSQIAGLESADLYIALGSGIEFENRWISRIKQIYPGIKMINLSQNIELYHPSGSHGEFAEPSLYNTNERSDPHIWMSLRNAAWIVNTTAEAMALIRPDMKDSFFKNKDNYNQKLADADQDIRESLKNLKTRTILVYHPAYSYFCRDYDLEQMVVEENGREPSSRKLADLITKAKSKGINIVFTEPEGSTRQAETLAREIDGTMILISPLDRNYLENMKRIAEKISGLS